MPHCAARRTTDRLTARRLLRGLAVLLILTLLAGCASRDTDDDWDDQRTVQALYADAQRQMRSGSYSMAISTFEDLTARFPFGDYAIQAQLSIIYAHHLADQPESTAAAADRFIRLYPRDDNVAYALYMRGMARESMDSGALGRMFGVDRTLRDPEPLRRAFSDYRQLVTDYPDSEYVDNATERMQRIREQLASYELYVTDFYLAREAWIAAANRATFTMGQFPGTGVAPEAMERLALAYEGLGMDDLAADVRERIAQLDEVPDPDALPLDEAPDTNGVRPGAPGLQLPGSP